MSDDWQVGDLALCVKTTMPSGLRLGMHYIVERVAHERVWSEQGLEIGLLVGGLRNPFSSDGAFASGRFRKIRPHTPDEQDAETIRLLNGIPVGEPA